MSRELLKGAVAAPEVSVGESGVDVAVARPTQRDGLAGVAPLHLAAAPLPTPHSPRVGARQEVVSGEGLLPDPPVTQLASARYAWDEVLINGRHATGLYGA